MKIERSFYDTERYYFDFGECSPKNGFAQVDTGSDAWYFGNWANPNTMEIVSFAEGDITRTICDTKEEFIAELEKMQTFHLKNDYRFGIDTLLNDELKQAFINIGAEKFLWGCKK